MKLLPTILPHVIRAIVLPVVLVIAVARLPLALFRAIRASVRRLLLPGRMTKAILLHKPCCEYHTGYLIAPLIIETYGIRGTVEIYQKKVLEAKGEPDEITVGVVAYINDNYKRVEKTEA
ncbi:hypothetical protein [Pseudomonas mediterranea]|uniref:hypothetical protein n=1 Tax=Pseudomonas mediterranea TaxID=183795 RepID=UPI0006D8CAEA|nr:hypothetical protein [Pseudomonas mediterranea]